MNPTKSARKLRSDPWSDETEAPFRRLTRTEAQAILVNQPQRVSPWWVLAVQAAIGVLVAAATALFGTAEGLFWSALYGAAVVVMPGALMARGMTSKLSSVSPGASAFSVMLWSTVKIGFSVALLMTAPKWVQPLSWPALLATMVACMQVYWLALLWRRR